MLAWSRCSVNIETAKARSIDPFGINEFLARGVRKVTTGITGLWRPSVLSDVAFWSFDVGSSYHCEAKFTKRRIVHPFKGTWAGFRPSWDRLVLPYWWSVITRAYLRSTRGTAGTDLWYNTCSIEQWYEATSVGLCLNASKAVTELNVITLMGHYINHIWSLYYPLHTTFGLYFGQDQY